MHIFLLTLICPVHFSYWLALHMTYNTFYSLLYKVNMFTFCKRYERAKHGFINDKCRLTDMQGTKK